MARNLTTKFAPNSPERLANGERIVKSMKGKILVLDAPALPTKLVVLGTGKEDWQQWLNSVYDVMNYVKKNCPRDFEWNNDWNEKRSFMMAVKQRKAA